LAGIPVSFAGRLCGSFLALATPARKLGTCP